uniref:glycerol kinase n=1 Tax=Aureoumbra lagunensis TaxID=44058 RepID=A0A7S3NKT3_9STRA|mmetsp:Transcript_12037/g.18065  ORF Transcript_12037/g.18065 Transcript_12037/m.18065 type:complete len:577 (-) Transcript_12037:173-1903(-)
MEKKLVFGALDQGTSSTRFVVMDGGQILGMAQKEHVQHHPEIGWVEHDLEEVWLACVWCIEQVMSELDKEKYQLSCIGITNQRETTCVFNTSGTPVCRAISWNCTRTESIVRRDHSRIEEMSKKRTGLPIASYFSATKLAWLREKQNWIFNDESQILFGTIDTFLLYRLSGKFVTDVTNASRTLLFNIHTLDWDNDLLNYWQISRKNLPQIEASIGGNFGTVLPDAIPCLANIPIHAVLGDQHAAAFGQCCFDVSDVKATLGTGAFILMNTGTQPIPNASGLLTTILYQIKNQPPIYALEGAVAVAGTAMQWLRDNLQLATSATKLAHLAQSTQGDNGGVYFVPAFNGLFAPHWDASARGSIYGLTSYATKAHLCRAALEAVAFQLDDLLSSFDIRPKLLKVDGGMTVNADLLQFCADIMQITVMKPKNLETTAAGAALAASLSFFQDNKKYSLEYIRRSSWQLDQNFLPALADKARTHLKHKWQEAVARSRGWEIDILPTTQRSASSVASLVLLASEEQDNAQQYYRKRSTSLQHQPRYDHDSFFPFFRIISVASVLLLASSILVASGAGRRRGH